MKNQQMILEEILSSAIRSALDAQMTAARNPVDEGKLMAYYDIITVAKEQAALIGYEFGDKTIAAFDPDTLLKPPAAKAA